MKNLKQSSLALAVLIALAGVGCKDKNKDIVLPDINGYPNSDAVASANLVAYFPLDGTGNEKKTGTAPTSSVNATYVSGVKGQAVSLASGYLYYASPLGALTSNQGFTLSAWVQVANNGVNGQAPPIANFPYSYFQSAIPGKLFGNVTGLIEAGAYGIASDTMRVKSIYQDQAGGTQDNVNGFDNSDIGIKFNISKKAGTNQWAHIVTTYNPAGGIPAQNVIQIYVDSIMVGNIDYAKRGTNTFKYSPNEIIIGAWYNNIPGKMINSDNFTQPFKGKIDEIRLYNKLLTRDEITALYKLGKAGR